MPKNTNQFISFLAFGLLYLFACINFQAAAIELQLSSNINESTEQQRHNEFELFQQQHNLLLHKQKIILTPTPFPNQNRNEIQKYISLPINSIDQNRLLLSSEKIPLNYRTCYTYLMEIGVGESEQRFLTRFGISRSLLWLASDTCPAKNCEFGKNRYKCSESRCENSTITYDKRGRTLKGNNAKDKISFGGVSTQYTFLSVNYIEFYSSFSPVDGELQFGVDKNMSFVHQLFLDQKIERDIFSLKINTKSAGFGWSHNYCDFDHGNSELMIGSYDEQFVKDESQIHYFKQTINKAWTVLLKRISFNHTNVMKTKNTLAVLEVGMHTQLYIPQKDLKVLAEAVEKSIDDCKFIDDIITCTKCDGESIERHPPIKFSLVDENGITFIINIPIKDIISSYEGNCIYQIFNIGHKGYWTVGDIFLRQVYSVFNYEKNTIGFVNLYNYDQAGDEIEKELKEEEQDDVDDDDIVAEGGGGIQFEEDNTLSSLLIFFFCLVFVYFCYFCYKKRQNQYEILLNNNEQSSEEMEDMTYRLN